jgi:hypothetical protein
MRALLYLILPVFLFAGVSERAEARLGESVTRGVVDLAEVASTPSRPRSETRRVILRVFGPRHGPAAVRVAWCESRLDRRALGAAGERGLFQIHPVHFGWVDERRLWEPRYNARIALRLSRGGRDWSPWTCRP